MNKECRRFPVSCFYSSFVVSFLFFSPASDVKGFSTKMHARGGEGEKKNPEKWIKKVNEK